MLSNTPLHTQHGGYLAEVNTAAEQRELETSLLDQDKVIWEQEFFILLKFY